MSRAPINLLVGLACTAALTAAPVAAKSRDPYAYRLQVTPEQGPTDPKIEARFTPEFDKCQDGAGPTPQIVACFADEFDRQDAELNRIWRITLRRTPDARKPALLAAQRRWLAARDPFCHRDAAPYKGGTIAPVIYVSCRVELTVRRTMWLERLR